MNFAISRILVPVDFSPHSDLAFRYATALASRLEASVELLHVVEDPIATGAWNSEIPIPYLPEIQDNLIEAGRRRLERYRAFADGPPLRMTTTVRLGLPSDTILEHGRVHGVDLIVMGTHGRSGLAHVFMGSVAERVVRHAACPVLTLHGAAARNTIESTYAAEPAALASALGHLGTSRE